MDRLVSSAWLEQELGRPDLRVLDCTVRMEVKPEGGVNYRSGQQSWENKHIPTSAHVDLIKQISDPSSRFPFMVPPANQFASVMSGLGVGDGTRVVLYDSGMNAWAARVWWMLRAFGFDHAAVLDGGWRSWTADQRPIATGPAPSRTRACFVPRVRPGVFVGRDEVLGLLGEREVCLVNALPADVHRGDRRDHARPGHIPGSCNVPFSSLVDPRSHRYLPVNQLRAAFSDVLAGAPKRTITYCGGAIAASSDAFILRHLGVTDVAIYDGSMSEWAADPSLPLMTEN